VVSAAPRRRILVTGATGRQGGSTARHLLRLGFEVVALARDPQSPAAQGLRALGAAVVAGDYEDPDSLREAVRGVYGVFSVQSPLGPEGVPGEEKYGKALADAAAEARPAHYVHSSVGGADRPEGVHWREAKLRVERHVRDLGLPATFLRPTYFMDNLNQYPPLLEDGELVYRRGLLPGRTLQMIASEDIGFFAAAAFADPATVGQAIELAGDELTGDQIAQAFARHTGLPARYEPIGPGELERISAWQATAYGWMNRIGYHADIPALRAQFPKLQTLADWLAHTGWKPQEHHTAPPAAGVPRSG
jgi:uncharacterized protein YbjT (DUF2867 family)